MFLSYYLFIWTTGVRVVDKNIVYKKITRGYSNKTFTKFLNNLLSYWTIKSNYYMNLYCHLIVDEKNNIYSNLF